MYTRRPRGSLLFALAWRLSLAFGVGALIGTLGGLWKSPVSYAVLADGLLLRFLLDRRAWVGKSFWDHAPLLLFLPWFTLIATHSLNFDLEQPLGLASSCFGLALITTLVVWGKLPLPRAVPVSPAYGVAATAGALLTFQIAFHFRALDLGAVVTALLVALLGSWLGGGLRTFAELLRTLPRYTFWKYRYWNYYVQVRKLRGLTTPPLPELTPEEPPVPPRWTLSRRSVLMGLAGVGGLAVTGIGMEWLARSVLPYTLPLVVYQGHPDGIDWLAWSPDGARIATAGTFGDQTIQIWEVATGRTLLTYRGHVDSYGISSLAWSPDGRQIASADFGRMLRLWDAATGREVASHQEQGYLAQWSPDGTRLASATDQGIQVWGVTSGALLLTYHPQQFVASALAWSPDGTRLVAGGYEDTADALPSVQVFHATTGETLAIYRHHSSTVTTATWSPDGKQIASASAKRFTGTDAHPTYQTDPTVHIWDAATGQPLFLYQGHSATVTDVAWSPDGQRIASSSDDHTVQVWNAGSGSQVFTYRGHDQPDAPPQQVAWSPDGQLIASASAGYAGTAHIWVPE